MKSTVDTFRVTFGEPGVFTYKCSIYTRIKGKIEVIGSVPLVKPPRSKLTDISKLIG